MVFTFHDWEHGPVIGFFALVCDDLELSGLVDEEEGGRPLLPRGLRPGGWHFAFPGFSLGWGLAACLEGLFCESCVKERAGSFVPQLGRHAAQRRGF